MTHDREFFLAALQRHQAGDLAAAKHAYEQILDADPAHVEALHLLGVIAHQVGRSDAAIHLIGKSLAIEPGFAEAHGNLGKALLQTGKLAAAAESFQRAVALKPDFADAYCNLGQALLRMERTSEALPNLRRAIELQPDFAEAHLSLGEALRKMGQIEDALASFRQAVDLRPQWAEACRAMGMALNGMGKPKEAIACFRQALALKPDFLEAHSALLFALNFGTHVTPAECLAEARAYGASAARIAATRFTAWNTRAADAGRLRIGFVSGDLHRHPVSYFLESLVTHLDRTRVELIAYHTHRKWDDVTERLRPHFDEWKLIAGLTDAAAARMIHGDGINVLFDLAGHTARNRLPVFAFKPAPVQVSWLGYFATTGLDEMDYVLADRFVAPVADAGHFTETLWRMPESYLCFTPPSVPLAVGPLPALAHGYITFGCFNNLTKVNDRVVAAWSQILHGVPDSKIFLKTKQLASPETCERLRERFRANGIAPQRLLLEPHSPRHELLAAYGRVDIALDPFPYPGGTTSSEALWMGVPTLTRRGDRFLSRVGESIAHNAGLDEWIGDDDADYIAKAVAQAGDLQRLAGLRAGLRQQALQSPLFDAPRFARHFENAIAAMWQAHLDS